MNYQEIFKISLLLISSPAKAWEEIRLQEDKRKVYGAFVYPMIGLCAFSIFLGSLFTHGWGEPESFQIAMTNCCVIAVSLFGGYFLASYLINEAGTRIFRLNSDLALIHQFAGYSLVVTFLTFIIGGVFPSFNFIGLLLQFYTIYIVWEGTPIIIGISGNGRLRFTLITFVLIIFCPVFIQFIFNKLLFFLN